jgi:hypothetical protein
MATITKGKTFVNGELVTPEKLHQLVDSATVANITNADIAANAAIADTKLATISTAGKVLPAAVQGTAVITTDSRLSDARTPISHTHDDRYYTETEMNTLLAGKQASGSYAPATGIAPSAITGTAVITTDSRLSDARTPTTHTHDDRYYTETEMNTLLAGKQASGSYAPATGIAATAITGTAVITTDSRLSDARTPTAHNHAATDITSGTLSNARTTATSANSASAIVARDASGNFSAGVITASGLSGNSVISRTLATEVSATSQINYSNYSGQFLSKVPKCDAADAQLHVPGIKCFGISNFSSGGNSGIYSVFAVSASGTTLVETGIGGILTNSTNNGVIYSTSSDYRLKTDLEKLTSALDRLSALPVHRFKWVGHPTAPKVDGFLAHEAQAVVPESVTGTKDAVDADGKPVYQGIDQSKLVPLLVAAVQELAARVAALEAK